MAENIDANMLESVQYFQGEPAPIRLSRPFHESAEGEYRRIPPQPRIGVDATRLHIGEKYGNQDNAALGESRMTHNDPSRVVYYPIEQKQMGQLFKQGSKQWQAAQNDATKDPTQVHGVVDRGRVPDSAEYRYRSSMRNMDHRAEIIILE